MPPSPAAITLQATRVTLRPVTAADADALFTLFADREVMRYWSRPPMSSRDEAIALVADILAGYRTGDFIQLAVEYHEGRQLIGTCTLFHFHHASRRAELGYALARRCWGQGLMREALEALLVHAFDALALHRLEADIDPRNTASANSLVRLGFRREGHLRERWIVGDVISDSALYGLLEPEWRARHVATSPGLARGER